MKRLLIIVLAAVLLVACGDSAAEKELRAAEKRLEEAKQDTERLEEVSKQIDETSDLISETEEEMGISEESLTSDQARELLEYEALGENDLLNDVIVADSEVRAVVEIADDDIFDDKSLLAETIYSRAGDSFLEHDGWEVLTIEFVDIGKVSMKRNEKETNEYGMDYFPLEKIIGQLE